MPLSALLDAWDSPGTPAGSVPRPLNVPFLLPTDAMNAHTARRPPLRSPIAINNRRSDLRLLALQLPLTFLGAVLLTTSLLA